MSLKHRRRKKKMWLEKLWSRLINTDVESTVSAAFADWLYQYQEVK